MFAVALICSGQSASITATLAGQIVSEGFIQWTVSVRSFTLFVCYHGFGTVLELTTLTILIGAKIALPKENSHPFTWYSSCYGRCYLSRKERNRYPSRYLSSYSQHRSSVRDVPPDLVDEFVFGDEGAEGKSGYG